MTHPSQSHLSRDVGPISALLPSQSLSHQVWPFLPSHCLSNLLFPLLSLLPRSRPLLFPLLSSVYLQEAVRKGLQTCLGPSSSEPAVAFPVALGEIVQGSHLAHGAQGCLALAHFSSPPSSIQLHDSSCLKGSSSPVACLLVDVPSRQHNHQGTCLELSVYYGQAQHLRVPLPSAAGGFCLNLH